MSAAVDLAHIGTATAIVVGLLSIGLLLLGFVCGRSDRWSAQRSRINDSVASVEKEYGSYAQSMEHVTFMRSFVHRLGAVIFETRAKTSAAPGESQMTIARRTFGFSVGLIYSASGSASGGTGVVSRRHRSGTGLGLGR